MKNTCNDVTNDGLLNSLATHSVNDFNRLPSLFVASLIGMQRPVDYATRELIVISSAESGLDWR